MLGKSTITVHADHELHSCRAVAPPIYQTAAFSAEDAARFAASAVEPRGADFHTRFDSHNHAQVAADVAELEGAEAAMVTASGMDAHCDRCRPRGQTRRNPAGRLPAHAQDPVGRVPRPHRRSPPACRSTESGVRGPRSSQSEATTPRAARRPVRPQHEEGDRRAVTADEVGDPARLVVSSTVNGEPRQKASVSDLIFEIPELISTISVGITLHIGDIIATGTPAGVGLGFNPPRFLTPATSSNA
ncbi:fumarylacetoacetate hydrolase family protein [Streptomyces prunicolor]|uniref:fumarylacetoacetate hydrolase family protein n=1 Tax=Streptomyces prunicolor TaxID=67348 RepID=UPI0037D607D8